MEHGHDKKNMTTYSYYHRPKPAKSQDDINVTLPYHLAMFRYFNNFDEDGIVGSNKLDIAAAVRYFFASEHPLLSDIAIMQSNVHIQISMKQK